MSRMTLGSSNANRSTRWVSLDLGFFKWREGSILCEIDASLGLIFGFSVVGHLNVSHHMQRLYETVSVKWEKERCLSARFSSGVRVLLYCTPVMSIGLCSHSTSMSTSGNKYKEWNSPPPLLPLRGGTPILKLGGSVEITVTKISGY